MEETQTTFYRADNGLVYVLDVNKFTAKIINSPKVTGDLVIPTKINYKDKDYVVTVIGEGAFKDVTALTSVKFENDSQLHAVEKNAFTNCGLTSIAFPTSVTRVGEEAFWECKNLKTVTFAEPSKLIALGKHVFPPELLPSLKFPNDVKEDTITTNLF